MQGPSRRKYGQYREGKEAHEGLGKIFQKGGGGPGASTGEPRKAQERISERDLGRPFVACKFKRVLWMFFTHLSNAFGRGHAK